MPPSEKQILQYVQRIRDLLQMDDDRLDASNHRIAVFSKMVPEQRYSAKERNTCTLYQVMVGSSMRVPATRFDFPGDDSVLTFLEGLATDLAPEEFVKLKEEFDRECGR